MERSADKTLVSALGSDLKNPILEIAASFWEEERYRAFRVCYSSMRRMDDLVDDLRTSGKSDDPNSVQIAERQLLEELARLGGDSELSQTLELFKIPSECWRRLANAMQYDLKSNGFPTFLSFRRYAGGAAIAPAAVFIHLIGLRKGRHSFTPAPVDIFANARSMALFSYLTHIIRDFRKDYAEGLEYIPRDMRNKFAVSDSDWAVAGAGSQTDSFNKLASEVHRMAIEYRRRSIPETLPVYDFLENRYRFSLHVIWELYSQILERIELARFELDPALIAPARADIVRRVADIGREKRVPKEILREGFKRLGVNEEEWFES